MAPSGRLAGWALLLVTAAGFLSGAAGKRSFPHLGDVRAWASELADSLKEIVDTAKFDDLSTAYASEVAAGRLSLQTINGTQLIQTSTNKMASSIAVRTKALKSLSEAAEAAVANHNYNQSIKVSDVPYYSAMDGNPDHRLPGLTEDKWLGGQTNRTNSSIHIPVNIYEQDAHVLNVISWSSHLDSVFIDNWQQNQEKLPWQAFASQTGVFRMYPARPMQPHRFGSMSFTADDRQFGSYDPRISSWYQQTISSPKDMLILLDTSGSVEGRSLSLMKHTTWFLLDRLTEDDYVATGYFNAYAQAVSCLSSFVQATTHNKEVIHKSLDNLEAANQANYYAGLEYAFKIFNNFQMEERDQNQGAECNRIIVLVTENAELYPEAVFQKYNSDRSIRVFVIVVGEPIHDWSVLQKMACDNRGYFSTVRSDGAAREASGDFGQVLSRPVALENSKEVTFSKIFMSEKGDDFEVYVSYPVINTTMDNPRYMSKDGTCSKNDEGTCSENQAVLGVVSVPWPVKEMRTSLPLRELGHGGYAFIINNNGFIVFHPHLTPEDAFYSKPPTLDLLDIEFTNPDKEAMRNRMVKLETGSDVINTLTKTHDHHYIDEVQMTYHYGPVTGTGFSIGLGIPHYHPGSLDVSRVSYQEGFNAFDTNAAGKLVLTPLLYCANYSSSPHKCQDNLHCKVREKIAEAHHLQQNAPEHCDEKMIQHVMLDAVVTRSHVTNHWQSLTSQFRSLGINSMFISGASGLTRVFPDGATPFHHDDSFSATYFTRSLGNKDVYMFHTPRDDDNADRSPPDINVVGAKAVKVPIQGQDVLPAVAGVNIDADKLFDKMRDITENCGCGDRSNSRSRGCRVPTPTSCMTCVDSDAQCFLLDDGGFIVATTRDDSQDSTGKFLGEMDGSLMMSLLQHEVYERVESYDFAHPIDDTACALLNQGDSAAPRMFVPIAELLRLGWWTTSVAWAYLRYYVYGSLLSAWLSVVGAQNPPTPTPDTIYVEDPDELRHHCVAKQTQYRFFGDFATNEGFRPWASEKGVKRDVPNCNCTREFAAARLANTNLLFVIADENCGTCNNTKLAQSQSFDVGPDLCAYQPRFRRRPNRSCHKQHQQEDTTQCMSGSTVLYTSASLLAVVLTLQLVNHRLQTTSL
ncbi:voltage-dependent calcium channel subunit alpha-2/delta-1-like isoform X2 [Branchiostoma floridae x Branchiostoma belcheri]